MKVSKIGLCLGLSLVLSSSAWAACDQQGAVNKMLALSQKLTELQTSGSIDNQKLLAANEKLNQGGGALAEGKYDEACRIYDEVAQENGFTLE